MKLKAYKTIDGTYSLRVVIESNILSLEEIDAFTQAISYAYISKEMYISIYKSAFPIVNLDEYFNYLYLTDISTKYFGDRLIESFPILLGILETKYDIEYVDLES